MSVARDRAAVDDARTAAAPARSAGGSSRAASSLPVPLSPVMSTVVSVAATRRARLSRSFIAGDWNTNWLCCKAERRSCTSAWRRRRSCSARTRCSSARCSRSRATASCAATPVSTGRSDLSRSRRLGGADQRQRAQHPPTGDQRARRCRAGRAGLGGRVEGHRPCRPSPLATASAIKRPLGLRDVAGAERHRLPVAAPLLPRAGAAGVVADEEPDALRTEQRAQLRHHCSRARRCRARPEDLQHVPQQAHVAVVLVGAAGEDAEEAIGGRRIGAGRGVVPRHDASRRLAAAPTASASLARRSRVERVERLGLGGLARHDADGAAQLHGVVEEARGRRCGCAPARRPAGLRAPRRCRAAGEDRAAVAHQHVGAAQQRLQRLHDLADHGVAGAAAVLRCSPIEADRIDEQQRTRQPAAAGAVQVEAQGARGARCGREAGERVGEQTVEAHDGRGERVRELDVGVGGRRRGRPSARPRTAAPPTRRSSSPAAVGLAASRRGRHAG